MVARTAACERVEGWVLLLEMLEMQDLSEALIFSLGVECESCRFPQHADADALLARKRLTIGVELASKPELLL